MAGGAISRWEQFTRDHERRCIRAEVHEETSEAEEEEHGLRA